MSEAIRARLEEVKRKLAASKAEEAAAASQLAAPVSSAVPTRSPLNASTAPPPNEAPPPFEMIVPSSVLLPTRGVALNYRSKPSTHTTSSALARSFLKGIKRERCDTNDGDGEVGSVRLGPITTSLVDIDERYIPQGKLGEGSYGTVTQAVEVGSNGVLRAVKEVQEDATRKSDVGYPPYLLREFDAVLRLQHPNLLHGIALGRSGKTPSVYLVTDHGGINLKDFLFSRRAFMHLSSSNTHPDAPNAVLAKAKCVAHQLLTGLAFMHQHCMLHRDLKTANILIDEKGTLRICDFGLARYYREGDYLTGGVVTLMYRAPEIHFGIPDYCSKVDVWSAGCVIGELLLKAPLFPAEREIEHFKKMCEVIGVPDDVAAFPGMLTIPKAMELMQAVRGVVPANHGNQLASLYANHPWYRGAKECADGTFIDLLTSMLRWNPKDRPTAAEALKHPWFTTAPLPCSPEDLLKPLPSGHVATPKVSASDAAAPTAALTADGADGDAADEAEACAGKQDLEVKSEDHDQRRHLLEQGGDLALGEVAEGDEVAQTPPL